MSNSPNASGTDTASLAKHGWAHVLGEVQSIAEVLVGRLSDTPLWKLQTQAGAFALRGWPASGREAAQRARLFAIRLREHGDIEAPIAISPLQKKDGDFLEDQRGQLWELNPWLEGESSFKGSPSLEKLQAMCRALAKVHQRASLIPMTGESARLQTTQYWGQSVKSHQEQICCLANELNAGAFDEIQSVWWESFVPEAPHSLPQSLRLGTELAQQLLRSLPKSPLPVQWCWGDAWHNNFLFAGSKVCGVVDFATVRIDAPAADLARLLGSAASNNPTWWASGLDAYETLRALSANERQATTALAASGTVLSLANWLRWLFIEPRAFRDAEAAQCRLQHFANRLAHLVRGL